MTETVTYRNVKCGKNNTTNELHKYSHFTHHCQKHADFELKTL